MEPNITAVKKTSNCVSCFRMCGDNGFVFALVLCGEIIFGRTEYTFI